MFSQPNRVYRQVRWSFDEGDGNGNPQPNSDGPGLRDANKAIAYPYLTYHGSPTWGRDSIIGKYLTFSANNYVNDISGRSTFAFTTGSFSFSCWVKFTGTSYAYPAVISNTTPFDSGGHTWGYALHIFASTPNFGAPYFQIGDGTHVVNNYSSSIPVINDGKWHLVVCVCDRAAQVLRMSIDGRAFFNSASISAVGTLAGGSSAVLRFGQSDEGGTTAFPGSLSDVRFWLDRAVSQAEVQALYKEKMLRRGGILPRRAALSRIVAASPPAAPIVQQTAVTVMCS